MSPGQKLPFEAGSPKGVADRSFVGYSHIVRAGNLVFVAGQVGRSPAGEVVGPGDAGAQATQAYENIRVLVEAAGSRLDRVAKLNIYATDPRYKPAIDEARKRAFGSHKPAATFVVVTALAQPEWLVEIEAIALVD